MPRQSENKASHISSGNVFADIGFAPAEASALQFKAVILSAILTEVRSRAYTQSQLVERLQDHQPQISNLLRGKISSMSIEKLLGYADRLNITMEVRRVRNSSKRGKAA
jgi:predicted XRE-type DNA-binding protein